MNKFWGIRKKKWISQGWQDDQRLRWEPWGQENRFFR